jgi:hypothetical protein
MFMGPRGVSMLEGLTGEGGSVRGLLYPEMAVTQPWRKRAQMVMYQQLIRELKTG